MAWEKYENKKLADKTLLLITIDPTHFLFNSAIGKFFKLEDNTRVIYHVDKERHKIGFQFTSEMIKGSYSVFSKEGSSTFRSSSSGLLKKYPWIKSTALFKEPSDRKFILKEDGIFWSVQLIPSFEHKINRSKINDIPSDTKGIYRYINDNEIVYIGIGNVKRRAQVLERKNWEFDTIEYSRLLEKSSQLWWEPFFLNKEKKKNGKLPRYNKIT